MESEIKARIEAANQEAINRIIKAEPVCVGIDRAINVIPGMKKNTILHAGPPIEYERMCFPQKNAVKGAIVYEGLAANIEEADKLAKSGEISIEPCHHHKTVGSMCGITSASMPVFIVRNETFGNEAYCIIYESPKRHKLIFGYFDEEVLAQLKWLEDVMWPAMSYAISKLGGINTKRIIARALSMGDECHSRHWAATASLALALMPVWLDGGFDAHLAHQASQFIANSEQFFLHLTMATCKATADPVEGIDYSTIVTAIARNGVEVGIKVSGMPGQWFTGPAGWIDGLYFSGFDANDSTPDLGDSAITETMGLGAACMAAAPAFEVVGTTFEKAINTSRQMDEITFGNNPNFPIATLNQLGAPTGIDIRYVISKGIAPIIDTGIAHNRGLGQIGVGNSRVPMEAFQLALNAFLKKYVPNNNRP